LFLSKTILLVNLFLTHSRFNERKMPSSQLTPNIIRSRTAGQFFKKNQIVIFLAW